MSYKDLNDDESGPKQAASFLWLTHLQEYIVSHCICTSNKSLKWNYLLNNLDSINCNEAVTWTNKQNGHRHKYHKKVSTSFWYWC